MANRSPYRWDEWFAKKKFKLTKGVEYAVQTHGMMSMVRTNASRRRLSITLTADTNSSGPDTISVEVLGSL